MSDDAWNIKIYTKYAKIMNLIFIENISKAQFLGSTIDGKVILEDFEEGKAEQLWKKGEPNAHGYFTLESYNVSKVITANSSSSLELKGKVEKILKGSLDSILSPSHSVKIQIMGGKIC